MLLSAAVPSRPGWMQIAWGQEQYKACKQPWSWEELTDGYVKGSIRFKMVSGRASSHSLPFAQLNHSLLSPDFDAIQGGLGNLMGKDGYESWLCLKDHPCSSTEGDYFCFAYHESNNIFTPWGENSILHMVDVTEDRFVLGEFCKSV